MAVDTRNKRASAVAFALPFGRVFPAPDGTIATADRKHIGFSYPGITAGSPASGGGGGFNGNVLIAVWSPVRSPIVGV